MGLRTGEARLCLHCAVPLSAWHCPAVCMAPPHRTVCKAGLLWRAGAHPAAARVPDGNGGAAAPAARDPGGHAGAPARVPGSATSVWVFSLADPGQARASRSLCGRALRARVPASAHARAGRASAPRGCEAMDERGRAAVLGRPHTSRTGLITPPEQVWRRRRPVTAHSLDLMPQPEGAVVSPRWAARRRARWRACRRTTCARPTRRSACSRTWTRTTRCCAASPPACSTRRAHATPYGVLRASWASAFW